MLWELHIGETFIVLHETGNDHDRHAMAVYHDEDLIVGHLPHEILKTCPYFTKHKGKISGKVTGCRIYSEVAGGMEIPYQLKFTSSSRNIQKLKQIYSELNSPAV